MLEQVFKKVKLFSGFIFKDQDDFLKVRDILIRRFSDIDIESDKIPFTFTNYYNLEMGVPLFRKFVSFTKRIDPEELSLIKKETNSIEIELMNDNKRTINIDPGYISDANVIIATAKNHYHRVPLKSGIYAHIEYVIKNKDFHFMEWTYPDFKSKEYLDFFYKLKELFKAK